MGFWCKFWRKKILKEMQMRSGKNLNFVTVTVKQLSHPISWPPYNLQISWFNCKQSSTCLALSSLLSLLLLSWSPENLLMDLGALVPWLLALLSVPLTTLPSLLLLSYLTFILPVKRNIFTHLDTLFLRLALARVYSGVSPMIDLLVLNTEL